MGVLNSPNPQIYFGLMLRMWASLGLDSSTFFDTLLHEVFLCVNYAFFVASQNISKPSYKLFSKIFIKKWLYVLTHPINMNIEHCIKNSFWLFIETLNKIWIGATRVEGLWRWVGLYTGLLTEADWASSGSENLGGKKVRQPRKQENR